MHAPGTCPGPGPAIYTPPNCVICYRDTYPENARGGSLEAPLERHPLTIIASRPDCYELGKVIQQTRSCGTKIRECTIHGQCTTERPKTGIACCATCADYVGPEMTVAHPSHATRHLAYHIYPVQDNGIWQLNVDKLCRRLWQFNGKKVVAIVTDPYAKMPRSPYGPDRNRHRGQTASPDEVKRHFGVFADEIEFLTLTNDPKLREVVSLVPMFERLPQTGVTLYAQAKGTTRKRDHIAHRWTQAMYELYLDNWPEVTKSLARYPVTGAFKRFGAGWHPSQSHSDWHYSGSWFWFRNADLFVRDWQKIDMFWSGIESYPAQQFLASESDCLFFERKSDQMNLYDGNLWREVIDKELAKWHRDKTYRSPADVT